MHDFDFFNSPFVDGAFGLVLPFLILLIAINLVLKGYALWYAARGGQLYWFIALLVINTMGILEIVYLLFFRASAPYKHVLEKHQAPPASSGE